MGGNTVNGPGLFRLLTSYVESINSGAIPSVVNAWEAALENQCKKAVEATTEGFASQARKLKQTFPIDTEDLNKKIHQCRKSAEERFASLLKVSKINSRFGSLYLLVSLRYKYTRFGDNFAKFLFYMFVSTHIQSKCSRSFIWHRPSAFRVCAPILLPPLFRT